MLKKYIDASLFKFLLVGILNTLIGTICIFCLYRVFNMGYWGATSLGYIVGGSISFLLNKKFTFKSKKESKKSIMPFVLVLGTCYFIAYGLAQKLVIYVISKMQITASQKIVDQIGILVGLGVFTILNYLGQKIIVFNK